VNTHRNSVASSIVVEEVEKQLESWVEIGTRAKGDDRAYAKRNKTKSEREKRVGRILKQE
jgi:hypothetical protein